MRAWLFQDSRQKKKFGEDKCPWSVGWIDPNGKRRSKKLGSKSMAEKFSRKKEGELAAGLVTLTVSKRWNDFRPEYEAKILSTTSSESGRCTKGAMNHFERIVKPTYMDKITTQSIDLFISKRSNERGRKKGDTTSPATINKELRHLKAVLRVAADWDYLTTVPKFRMLREPQKLIRYITEPHFSAIYSACDHARMPREVPIQSNDWWRALLVFSYLTGWRIGEPLALKREDLDLIEGTAITRHKDNKGKRDECVPLHPLVIEHLTKIQCFEPMVFPWFHGRRSLWKEFHYIQQQAKIHLPCEGDHEHTDACHVYGFHDCRRAFASLNADKMSAEGLQKLMRHQSYTTTQKYINMAKNLNSLVENLHVPDILKKAN